jgi:hypothetical protein
MQTSTMSRYAQELVVLRRLLPAYQSGIVGLQELAMRFSNPGWKDLFVHLWSQQANGLTELEEKIWEMGGDGRTPRHEEDVEIVDSDDTLSDPLLLDKALLLRCINQQTRLLRLCADAKRSPLPFDVRMILQRHQLQMREMVDRLSSMYLTYPHRKRLNLEALVTSQAA